MGSKLVLVAGLVLGAAIGVCLGWLLAEPERVVLPVNARDAEFAEL